MKRPITFFYNKNKHDFNKMAQLYLQGFTSSFLANTPHS